MEAILSYMHVHWKGQGYRKDCLQTTPSYGLIDLRKICEEVLARSLKSDTAVITLMYASVNNASDLKKLSLSHQISHLSSKNEWWGKLKEKQMYRELWVELLEYLHCR
jgi:hypothetical protein